MNYKRLNKSFQKFIDQDDHFTEDEQQNILNSFESKRNQKIFRLSIYLLIWSTIGLAIDSTFIGGGVIASIFMGVNIIYFLPTILFSVGNFIAKFFFVRWYMRGDISTKQAVYSGIPYAGSAFILGFLLNDEPLFLRGLKHYLTYMNRRGFRFICKIFRKKKNCTH